MLRTVTVTSFLALVVMVSPAYAKTTKVDAFDFAFNPDPAKVKKGDKVKWTSTEGDHDVVFKSGPSFDEKIDKGQSTRALKFNDSGTFKYICTIHKSQGMKGKVKVK